MPLLKPVILEYEGYIKFKVGLRPVFSPLPPLGYNSLHFYKDLGVGVGVKKNS